MNTVTFRRRSAWPWVAVGVIIVLVGALVVWGTLGGRSETRQSTVDAPQRLRIDSAGGDVTVTGTNDSQVQIERRLSWSISRPEPTERRRGDTLELGVDCDGPGIFFNKCQISYTVRVPSTVKLDISTGSGDVTVTDVAGATVRTGSGEIEVVDVSGDVNVRAGSGSVLVRGATGRVEARTGSGDLTARSLGGDADFRTGSGTLDAQFSSIPTSVSARTGSGDLTLTVPRARYEIRGADSDEDVDVDSTSGAPNVIDVSVGSGDLRISYAG